MHPKEIGDRSTLAIIAALRECGYDVLLPFGENTRYDLVIDDGIRLVRVQCKTGRLRRGAVRFKTSSTYAHHPNPKLMGRNYEGEVDFFAVFCPETRGVYLVPIEKLGTRWVAQLRVDPARNGQVRGIRDAREYEVARVAITTGAPGARADG